MIKSDLMKRMLLVFLSMIILLPGCGQKREPDVEHFQSEVVATLQKPVSEPNPNLVEPTPAFGQAPTELALPSQPVPTNAPEGTSISTVSAPEATGYPGEVTTPTITPQPSRTASLTQTPSPTFGISSWDGAWNIWYQNSSGGYSMAVMTLAVENTSVSGSARIDGIDLTFKGEIFSEGTQAEGQWKTASTKGSFWWRMSSEGRFVGSREKRFGFCGDRLALQPNPCREVPPD